MAGGIFLVVLLRVLVKAECLRQVNTCAHKLHSVTSLHSARYAHSQQLFLASAMEDPAIIHCPRFNYQNSN